MNNIASGALGVIIGAATLGGLESAYQSQIPAPSPVPAMRVVAGKLDVLDLIERLRPLIKKGDPEYYWESGVTITFRVNGVRAELELANGDKYSGEAKTLDEAVRRVTSPSTDIAKALDGWGAN